MNAHDYGDNLLDDYLRTADERMMIPASDIALLVIARELRNLTTLLSEPDAEGTIVAETRAIRRTLETTNTRLHHLVMIAGRRSDPTT